MRSSMYLQNTTLSDILCCISLMIIFSRTYYQIVGQINIQYKIFMQKKQSASVPSGCLSDKDIQLIRKTYAKLTELYYENPKNQSAVADLINLGHLITQIVTTKRQADGLSLVSIVQTLKVKSKSRPEVLAHIDLTVNHLRLPCQKPIKYQTLLYSLQKSDLFVIGCTVAIRFYQKIHSNASEFNWKEIIGELSRNIAISPTLCIQLAFEICRENELNSRWAVKSGLIKYVFLSYISSALDNKFNLYKSIKLLKVVANAENTLIREKQKPLALVIYTYEDYIPVIEGIISKCYDGDYCQAIDNNKRFDPNTLDQFYLWSYLQAFCLKNLTQTTINLLIKTLTSPLDQITQTKIYGILANFAKFRKIILKDSLQILPKTERSLLNYIKMCVSCCEIDHNSSNFINLPQLQKLVDKNSNPKVDQLFRYLKQLKNKQNKIGALDENIKKMFDMEKNADFMMERASKIPQNNQQLTDIRQILKEKDRTNQFESDTLRAVKQRALQSLHTAIIQKKKLDLNPIFQDIDLGDVKMLARLLQILELCLMINNDLIDSTDTQRVIEIIQWIEDNYNGEMIEWGSIGQLLIILKQDNQWINHISTLPNSCFWLLSVQDFGEQEQNLLFGRFQLIAASSQMYVKKIPLMMGFISRAISNQSKLKLYSKFSQFLALMTENIKNNSSFSYKINLLMLASFFRNSFKEVEDEHDRINNKAFQQIVDPLVKIVFNNFRSLEQQYQFLQSILPYEFKYETLSDNLDYLISMFGKLASCIYKKCQNMGIKVSISYDRIKAVGKISYEKSKSILQILKFLENNSSILQSDQLSMLLQKLVYKKFVYWYLYPNFYSIISKVLSIISKTANPIIKPNISSMLYKIIVFIAQNQDISVEQKEDLLKEVKQCLEILQKNTIAIEKDKLKKGAEKISYKVVKQNKQQIVQGIKQMKQQILQVINKYKVMEIKKQSEKSPSKQMNLQINTQISQRGSISFPEISSAISQISKMQQEQDINQENQHIAVNLQSLNNNEGANNQQQIQMLDALRLLKRIIEKQEPQDKFPKLYNIFTKNDLKPEQTDILGHLLALFYPNRPNNMQQDALTLLMNKEKTRLSRQSCYQLMKKYSETFCLSRRWKLIGRQWLDLAMLRFSEGFYGDASQVAEHNLSKSAELQYFYSKSYHQIILNNYSKIQNQDDYVLLLVLVGTCARNTQIKNIFCKQKLHSKVVQSITKYPEGPKFIANLSYALSALVYMQPQVCNQLIKHKNQLQLLLNAFKVQVKNKSIVESGACLVANLSYSNEQVKQSLRQLNVIQVFLFLFQNTLQSPQISTFKQILRAFGNLSLSPKCTQQLIDQHFCALAARMAQKIDVFVNFDDKKAALMKILIDLIANLASHRYKLQIFHKQKLTTLIIDLLETTHNHLSILTACIDTIDCLCQNSYIENYVVVEKKIPYLLIDILKIQADQKIVVKSTRLLTNLTINVACIPHILQANLLHVLANIVMPHFYGNKLAAQQNKKMETYILKIITRIFHSKPSKQVILKSGYLDCLIKTIQKTDNIQDSYIQILYQYSQIMPNFLNKRAFLSLIRILTRKVQVKEVANKALRTIKNLSTFYERDQEDILISGTSQLYEKILASQLKKEGLNLLCYHLLRSDSVRQLLRKKLDKVLQMVKKLSADSDFVDICKQILFLIYNPYLSFQLSEQLKYEGEYQQLKKGFRCNLYRIDGTSKKAIIDMNQQYQIRAYKYPDGQIKSKYIINVKNIKDFQFNYPVSEDLWGVSVFSIAKGLFDSKSNPKNCGTLISNPKWGEISYINVQFETEKEKLRYYYCLRTIFNSLR